MPVAAAAGVVSTSFIFEDNNDNFGGTSLYRDTVPADSLDTIVDDIEVVRAALAPLSNARSTSAGLSGAFQNLPRPAAPPPESDVRRKLVLVFATTNQYSKVRMEIPSPVFGIETAGTNRVDPANPLVAALVAAIANPLGTSGWVSPTGFPITELEEAYIDVRQRKSDNK